MNAPDTKGLPQLWTGVCERRGERRVFELKELLSGSLLFEDDIIECLEHELLLLRGVEEEHERKSRLVEVTQCLGTGGEILNHRESSG